MVESSAANALQSLGKHPISGKKGIKKADTVTDTIVSITVSVMVREMGLEPTRHNHTHLKRACLPFQHSREDA